MDTRRITTTIVFRQSRRQNFVHPLAREEQVSTPVTVHLHTVPGEVCPCRREPPVLDLVSEDAEALSSWNRHVGPSLADADELRRASASGDQSPAGSRTNLVRNPPRPFLSRTPSFNTPASAKSSLYLCRREGRPLNPRDVQATPHGLPRSLTSGSSSEGNCCGQPAGAGGSVRNHHA